MRTEVLGQNQAWLQADAPLGNGAVSHAQAQCLALVLRLVILWAVLWILLPRNLAIAIQLHDINRSVDMLALAGEGDSQVYKSDGDFPVFHRLPLLDFGDGSGCHLVDVFSGSVRYSERIPMQFESGGNRSSAVDEIARDVIIPLGSSLPFFTSDSFDKNLNFIGWRNPRENSGNAYFPSFWAEFREPALQLKQRRLYECGSQFRFPFISNTFNESLVRERFGITGRGRTEGAQTFKHFHSLGGDKKSLSCFLLCVNMQPMRQYLGVVNYQSSRSIQDFTAQCGQLTLTVVIDLPPEGVLAVQISAVSGNDDFILRDADDDDSSVIDLPKCVQIEGDTQSDENGTPFHLKLQFSSGTGFVASNGGKVVFFWGFLADSRYLLHDRDSKFCLSFRQLIEAGRVKTMALPARSPNLNAYAERWVRTVKQKCLSKLILFGERPLRRSLQQYVVHYHEESNHQGKQNRLLFPLPNRRATGDNGIVRCKERLGGLLKYYEWEAA